MITLHGANGIAGMLTYDPATNTLQLCDGTAWQALATGAGGGGGKFVDGTNPNDAVYTTGNVGIGTATPVVKLDVVGAIVSRVNNAGAGTSIDWSLSNTAYTSANCGAFTLSNMQNGGNYTLFVKGTTAATCSFTHAGLTFKMPPGHGATTSSKMTVYSFTRAGSDVFVTWVPGY
jgi:hypothetical protein